MNNGYQESNGCGADKEGGKFFKTFFYPNAQSKHVRPLAYNGIHTQCVITNNLRKEKNNDRRNENSTAKQRR
jgi:hypothetical protein